jgi:hypothetical protein
VPFVLASPVFSNAYDSSEKPTQFADAIQRAEFFHMSDDVPGLFGRGFQDITALSYEMSETFNDPFANNATPWWLSPSGQWKGCQTQRSRSS